MNIKNRYIHELEGFDYDIIINRYKFDTVY